MTTSSPVEEACLQIACKTLTTGGVICYATESVFGLGCNPFDDQALHNLLAVKQRKIDKGLILIASDFSQLADFLLPVESELYQTIQKTWPGPVTWILPAKSEVSDLLTGGRDSLAVRVTAHPQVRKLCQQFGGAITSTSANLSGEPAIKNFSQAEKLFADKKVYCLPGEVQGLARPSKIIDGLTGKVLRE